MKKRVLMMLMAFVYILTMMAVPAAAYSNVDVLQDYNPSLRYDWLPVMFHDISEEGDYTGTFTIHSFTYTNCTFNANEQGIIYYRISGTSEAGGRCAVETWCMDCNDKIGSFKFYPSDCPCNRMVSVTNTHRTHEIYFKIIASILPEEFSGNDFSGTILVSWEPTT